MLVARKHTERAMNCAVRICASLENFDFLSSLLPFVFVCLFVCLFDCFSQYCARGAQVGAMGIDLLYLRIPTQKYIPPSIYDKILILDAIDEGYPMPILRQEVT